MPLVLVTRSFYHKKFCAEQGLKRKTCWKLLLSNLALIKCQGDNHLKFRFGAKEVLRKTWFGQTLTPPACLERSFLVTYLGVFSCLLYCKQIYHHIHWSLKKKIVDRAPTHGMYLDLKGRGWKTIGKTFSRPVIVEVASFNLSFELHNL